MMKISDLQRQIALNRASINLFEESLRVMKDNVADLREELKDIAYDEMASRYRSSLCVTVCLDNKAITKLKRVIKQYAKLQRALKSELAYRIQYNRAVREIESARDENEDVEWVIVSDEVFDKMLKGE